MSRIAAIRRAQQVASGLPFPLLGANHCLEMSMPIRLRATLRAATAVAALCLAPAAASAQRLVVRWSTVDVEQGLSQSTVRAVLQDGRGFLWLGTADGLNRWDGYDFIVHRHDPSNAATLPANDVLALMEGAAGFLWVGTAEGVARFDPRSNSFERCAAAGPTRAVSSIAQTANGDVWFAAESGLWRSPGGATTLERVDGYVGAATAVFADGDALWAGGPDGLHRVDANTGLVEREAPPGLDDLADVTALLVDAKGDLWIGTRSGLAWWRRAEGRASMLPCDPADEETICGDAINALCRSDSNLIYAATRNGVARIIPTGKGSVRRFYRRVGVPRTLGDAHTLSLCIDRSRNLWVGTAHGGANRLDLKEGRFPHYVVNRVEPGRNSVTAIMPTADGPLWVGTEEDGLFECQLPSNQIVQYVHDPADPASISPGTVTAIGAGREGLWVAAGGVLNRRRDAGFEHLDPGAGAITCVFPSSVGDLWLATEHGLLRFDEGERLASSAPATNDAARELARESVTALAEWQGALWAGTERRGLFRYDPRAGTARRFGRTGDATGIVSNEVVSLLAGGDDGIWVGTRSGLSRFEPAREAFRSWRRGDGLANEIVCGMMADARGQIWLGTLGGLSRMSADGRRIDNFDVADGLQGSQFNPRAVARSGEGELYFGGYNGMNAFFPERIGPTAPPPPIAITGFRVFDEPQVPSPDGPLSEDISLSETIRIPWRMNVIGFESAALDFTEPANNRYAYMLEGFDRDWVACGTRRLAMYTNLPGGEYVFRVRAANGNDVWNEEGASVRLVVRPPVWQTMPFRIAVPVAVLLAVSAWWAARLRRADKRRRELERLVDERTSALAASETRFRTLFESAPIAVAIVREGRWVHFNPACRALFGYESADAMLGVPFEACCAPESRADVRRDIFAPDAVAPVVADRVLGLRRDGATFPLQLVGSRIELPDGPAHALFCIDLTEIEGAREKLEGYAQELEERNREVKQFAYIVSHDLKAPLVNLQGFAGELDKAFRVINPVLRVALGQLDERTRRVVEAAAEEDVPESLSFIRSSVARMEALVTALLNLSRIGRRDLVLEELDMGAIARSCAEGLSHMIEERGAAVAIAGMPAATADRTAMEQVFGNVLANAVLYLDPERPGRIEVWGERDGEFAAFHVKDNGRGIAENEMDKVFAPFRRAGRQDVPGEGMGLAYVRALVRRHGGTIECRSKLGVGTQMTVRLPVKAGPRGEESVA